MNKEKIINIIIEGTSHEWVKDDITYEEVVALEVPNYNPKINYSVKYHNGHGSKPEGILSPGGSVKTKDGMIFNVSETSES